VVISSSWNSLETGRRSSYPQRHVIGNVGNASRLILIYFSSVPRTDFQQRDCLRSG